MEPNEEVRNKTKKALLREGCKEIEVTRKKEFIKFTFPWYKDQEWFKQNINITPRKITSELKHSPNLDDDTKKYGEKTSKEIKNKIEKK